jgi:integrase
MFGILFDVAPSLNAYYIGSSVIGEEVVMTVSRITKRAAEALPQGGYLWDTEVNGFGARRQTKGVYYILRYRLKGKQHLITIGRHGSPWTVEMARNEALRLLGQIVTGTDPLADRHAPAPETLGPIIDRYLARKKPEMKPRAFVEVERHLARQSSPLHGLALAGVDRAAVASLLNAIQDGSGPVARNAVRASLSALWSWAIREGLTEMNPVKGTGKAAVQSRDRVLTDKELVTIWRNLGDDQFGDIVRLLLLTGQRRDEIGSLRWSEIAGDTIILPPARTKNSRRHEVPLSPQAAAILARQPRRPGRDLIFGFGAGGYSAYDKAKVVLDRRVGLPHWTLHDIRRTVATMMHDQLDVQPHHVEAILNHVSGHKGGVAGVYNRAKYLEPMRKALGLWANYIDALVNPKPHTAPEGEDPIRDIAHRFGIAPVIDAMLASAEHPPPSGPALWIVKECN